MLSRRRGGVKFILFPVAREQESDQARTGEEGREMGGEGRVCVEGRS
jgi:hypothetical protein